LKGEALKQEVNMRSKKQGKSVRGREWGVRRGSWLSLTLTITLKTLTLTIPLFGTKQKSKTNVVE
jgi:hypothetical protein